MSQPNVNSKALYNGKQTSLPQTKTAELPFFSQWQKFVRTDKKFPQQNYKEENNKSNGHILLSYNVSS